MMYNVMYNVMYDMMVYKRVPNLRKTGLIEELVYDVWYDGVCMKYDRVRVPPGMESRVDQKSYDVMYDMIMYDMMVCVWKMMV